MTSPPHHFDGQLNGHLQAPSGPTTTTLRPRPRVNQNTDIAAQFTDDGALDYNNDRCNPSLRDVPQGIMLDPSNPPYEIYEVDEEAISRYNDLVRDTPELAITLEDVASSLGFELPPEGLFQFLPVSHTPQEQCTGTHTSLNQAVASSFPPSTSNAPIEDPEKVCFICRKTFDRHGRARDHVNWHIGLKPYRCGGRCGDHNCNSASWSEERLNAHVDRFAPCSWCGKVLTKKNMDRHKKVPCPKRRSLVASNR